MKDSQGDLKTLGLYVATSDCPLGHSELLVYAYLGYRQAFGCSAPSNLAVAAGTGLHRHTVSAVRHRLEHEYGLVDGANQTGVKAPPEGWFRGRRSTGTHWSGRLAFWKSYVRAADSPLTTPAVTIYSYLLAEAGRQNDRTISDSYLSQVAGVRRETATSALSALADVGLLHPDVSRYAVQPPGLEHLPHFATARQKQVPSAPVLVSPRPAPAVPVHSPPSQERDPREQGPHSVAAVGVPRPARIGAVDTEVRFECERYRDERYEEFRSKYALHAPHFPPEQLRTFVDRFLPALVPDDDGALNVLAAKVCSFPFRGEGPWRKTLPNILRRTVKAADEAGIECGDRVKPALEAAGWAAAT